MLYCKAIWEVPMDRILSLALAVLIAISVAGGPALGRAMEIGGAESDTGGCKHCNMEGPGTHQGRRIGAPGENLWLGLHHRSVGGHRHQQARHRWRGGHQGDLQ